MTGHPRQTVKTSTGATGQRRLPGSPGVGFDLQNKHLTRVGEATEARDAITKHQLQTGIQQVRAYALMTDSYSYMKGDLDTRGNRIILPSEINMDGKLITELGTDKNQDLSTVI